MHARGTAFFGLRQIDLAQLDGHNSFICFFTDDQSPPLFVPHSDFERVIRQSPLAADGQYKAQLVASGGTHELYIPRVGRFNVDGFAGIDALGLRVALRSDPAPLLNHSQIQTLGTWTEITIPPRCTKGCPRTISPAPEAVAPGPR
jgi:hypothetical protein